MQALLDARSLETEIRLAYEARLARDPKIQKLGWRLLYSPERVLNEATVAFIGLHPGGSTIDPSHGVFSSENGSAYRKEIETWPSSTGLQDQVIALFRHVGVEPDDVLAGNLVPFRSRCEACLDYKKEAISFGLDVWRRIFTVTQPSLIITMGDTVNKSISEFLKVHDKKTEKIGWGSVRSFRGRFDIGAWSGSWIGLPHLSQFRIMSREACKVPLDVLFSGLP
jgi:hypothetical protein